MLKRNPQLQAALYHAMQAALGTHQLALLIVVAVLLASLGWFADFLYEVIGGARLAWLFPVSLLAIWWLLRNYRNHLKIQVIEEQNPPKAKGVLMFLSRLNPDALQLIQARLDNDPAISLLALRSDPDLQFFSWQMNLEAIAHHIGRIQYVMVLPSPQSQEQFAIFKQLVKRLWPGVHLQIETLPAANYKKDIHKIAEAVEQGFRQLTEQCSLSPGDQVIDITSGTSLATTAGVIIAQAEGRRIQYVEKPDAEPCQVLQADISFRKE